MSEAVRELVDVEALITRYLEDDDDLRNAGVKQVSGPGAPNDPDFPAIRIHRSGGVAYFSPWIDAARVQIDVWGQKDTAQLRRITSLTYKKLMEMRGVHEEGVVTDVTETVGRVFLPAPDTKRIRYLFEVRVTTHPRRDSDVPPSSGDGVALEVAEDDSVVATLSSDGGITIEEV